MGCVLIGLVVDARVTPWLLYAVIDRTGNECNQWSLWIEVHAFDLRNPDDDWVCLYPFGDFLHACEGA